LYGTKLRLLKASLCDADASFYATMMEVEQSSANLVELGLSELQSRYDKFKQLPLALGFAFDFQHY